MKSLIDSLQRAERYLARTFGPFSLFAIMEKEESPGEWSLVVAGPWISPAPMSAIPMMNQGLKKHLKPRDLARIAQILPLPEQHELVRAFQRAFGIRQGSAIIQNCTLFGIPIKNAVLFVSNGKRNATVANAVGELLRA